MLAIGQSKVPDLYFLLSYVFRRRRCWISKFLHSLRISIWFFWHATSRSGDIAGKGEKNKEWRTRNKEWGTRNDDFGHEGSKAQSFKKVFCYVVFSSVKSHRGVVEEYISAQTSLIFFYLNFLPG